MSRFHQLCATAGEQLVPLEVSIELTARCNFHCRHCYLPRRPPPDELRPDRVHQLIDELADLGALFLTVTGGEALLHGEGLAILRHARHTGFAVNLLTNGSSIDTDTANVLDDLHVRVGVSLYTLDPDTFAAITGVPGSLAQTLAGIERLRAAGVDVLIKVPLMAANADAAPSVEAWAERIGADCQSYTEMYARRDGDDAPLTERVPPRPAAAAEPARRTDSPLCGAGNRHAHITSTGDVLACGVLPLVAGNIREQSFASVWYHSPVLAELRALRQADLGACAACDRLSICGRCHAQALHEHGTLAAPSSVACQRAGVTEST